MNIVNLKHCFENHKVILFLIDTQAKELVKKLSDIDMVAFLYMRYTAKPLHGV